MANKIGILSFVAMQGRPLAAADGLECRERPGEDGSELRLVGRREAMAMIVTTATAADAETAASDVEAQRGLVGTIQTVEDGDGNNHEGVAILDCQPIVRAIGCPTSNPAHTRLIVTRWTVRQLHAAE